MGYDLRKIKYSCDGAMFARACGIYNSGKIKHVKRNGVVYDATVIGNHPYQVSVSTDRFGYGDCECYMGQNDELCKHLVALSVYVIKNGAPLSDEDIKRLDAVEFSGRVGEPTENEIAEYKINVSKAMKLIRSWSGGSKGWFEYQDRLSEGCGILMEVLSIMPASQTSTRMIIRLLQRLDAKLLNGIDDSDGTVGGFMISAVDLLNEFAKVNPECRKEFAKIDREKMTCFGWWENLDD